MKRKTGFLFKFVIIAVFLLVAGGQTQAGKVMQKFVLSSAIGGPTINSDDFKGKVLLINFWATWCPPCRTEIPSLIKLQEEFGPDKFSVIGISEDTSERTVVNFVAKRKINYPVAMTTNKIKRDFGGITGIPANFLIDQQGMIVKRYWGLIAHEQLQHDVNTLLGK
ncbi:MAG: TlpA family protein disulfide reductase [Proteobacteria bacterium]|nr:TlpA family protein disulfide reductase [Pseudomonadota bacterium]MBU1716454.1 TlpA family protein disulfide reductase [Pseudomonadota bacterium]